MPCHLKKDCSCTFRIPFLHLQYFGVIFLFYVCRTHYYNHMLWIFKLFLKSPWKYLWSFCLSFVWSWFPQCSSLLSWLSSSSPLNLRAGCRWGQRHCRAVPQSGPDPILRENPQNINPQVRFHKITILTTSESMKNPLISQEGKLHFSYRCLFET